MDQSSVPRKSQPPLKITMTEVVKVRIKEF